MAKAKIYSTNVSGETKSLRVKAYSLKQLAQYLGVSLYRLRPYVSVCGPAVQQADVDLIEKIRTGECDETF